MKKQIFSIIAVGILTAGCGTNDIVKVDKPDGGISDNTIKKSLKITEDKNNIIHIHWDLSTTSGYGLILEYQGHKKGLSRGLSHQVLDMSCEPVSSTTTAIKYECRHKGQTKKDGEFTVYDGIDYNFKIESGGTDSFGNFKWVLSEPVATLTLKGLK
jgi:hypothetical protein